MSITLQINDVAIDIVECEFCPPAMIENKEKNMFFDESGVIELLTKITLSISDSPFGFRSVACKKMNLDDSPIKC